MRLTPHKPLAKSTNFWCSRLSGLRGQERPVERQPLLKILAQRFILNGGYLLMQIIQRRLVDLPGVRFSGSLQHAQALDVDLDRIFHLTWPKFGQRIERLAGLLQSGCLIAQLPQSFGQPGPVIRQQTRVSFNFLANRQGGPESLGCLVRPGLEQGWPVRCGSGQSLHRACSRSSWSISKA